MKKIKVLLAEDHTIVRQGLKRILEEVPEIEVVGEASTGREAVCMSEKLRPDVVVIDITMPQLNGLEATRQIVRILPRTKVLVLTMHANEEYIRQMLKAGARGYLLKDAADSDLIAAITALERGSSFLSPAVSKIIIEDYVQWAKKADFMDRYELLTNREREILQLIAEGKTNKEIAKLLCLSIYTVNTHRRRIMEKLDLHSTAEIVAYAMRKGIVG